MSKALTLALALAAGRADAGGLLVSALFGTEPPSYVHAAVANVLGFTLQEAAQRDRGRPEEGTVVQAARPRERDRGAPPSGSTRERDALASPAAPAAP